MSNQGWTVHCRGRSAAELKKDLTAVGIPAAILASSAAWTTFVPLGSSEADLAALSRRSGCCVLNVGFDEDTAVALLFSFPDGWSPQWFIPTDGEYELAEQDNALLLELRKREVLSATMEVKLRKGLSKSGEAQREWLWAHKVEELLDVPFSRPVPVGATRKLLKTYAPKVTFVTAKEKPPSGEPPPSPAVKREWTAAEAAVVDLHFHYVTELWNLNDWKLYNRYKKHLPPSRRAEVDRLIDNMMRGGLSGELRASLEAILATVWAAEDWFKVIANPELVKWEPLDPAQLRDWDERLARASKLISE